jgi:pimeloyl-ACP methyl ester carboxylesterase
VRALAITQRGHGRSSKPHHGYLYADMADDLEAFMDALDLRAAVIVGHSMGSLVAQRFAVDHPQRVAGLVLVGAFRTMHRDRGMQEYWDTTLATLADPVPVRVAREFQESTIANPVPAYFVDVAVNESLQLPARVWQAVFKGFLDTPDFSAELARVTAPALLVWGDKDSYTGRAAQDALHAVLPASRLIVYEGTGHAVHWEEPQRFAGDLVRFVYERR